MTVDTEKAATFFLTNHRFTWFRTGSREICDPAPMDTDVDFVLLCDAPHWYERIEEAGFVDTSAAQKEGYDQGRAPFSTYRCGEVNLIVTDSGYFYDDWRGATIIAKRLNLLEKAHRIALFQGILYTNWSEWLAIDHSGDIPL